MIVVGARSSRWGIDIEDDRGGIAATMQHNVKCESVCCERMKWSKLVFLATKAIARHPLIAHFYGAPLRGKVQ
jgi:hypothetical protein